MRHEICSLFMCNHHRRTNDFAVFCFHYEARWIYLHLQCMLHIHSQTHTQDSHDHFLASSERETQFTSQWHFVHPLTINAACLPACLLSYFTFKVTCVSGECNLHRWGGIFIIISLRSLHTVNLLTYSHCDSLFHRYLIFNLQCTQHPVTSLQTGHSHHLQRLAN